MKARHFRNLAITGAASILLAGCNQPAIKMCPVPSILADTANYPGFRAGQEGDPAAELYTARLVNVTTDCEFDAGAATTDSEVALHFRATRAPTGETATYTVPYYVAVTYANQILAKQIFNVEFTFRPGSSSVEFDADVESILTKIETGKLPYDYQILVGMQLTESQLNYIKQMGRFTP